MTTYLRQAIRGLGPSWLTEEEGGKVLYSLAVVLDAMRDRVRLATYARFPQYAPSDALKYMSRDRRILRGINEDPESFAARLIPWRDDHRKRGNPWKLGQQLQAYCNAAVRVRTVDQRGNWFTVQRDGTLEYALDSGNWDWDGAADSPAFARFWVIIYPTTAGEPWDDDTEYGDGRKLGDGSHTIGTSATAGEVSAVRSIVRDWKPAGTRCEKIIIAFDDTSFDPTAPEPDGTWDLWGKNSVRAKNRLATARYWKGTGP